MEIDDAYRVWAQDSEILAEIGREMFLQPTKITVRIPRQLAEQARAAWERDDYKGPLPVRIPSGGRSATGRECSP
jgi:hypothetical protein